MHVRKKENQKANFIFWEALKLLGWLSRVPEDKKNSGLNLILLFGIYRDSFGLGQVTAVVTSYSVFLLVSGRLQVFVGQ